MLDKRIIFNHHWLISEMFFMYNREFLKYVCFFPINHWIEHRKHRNPRGKKWPKWLKLVLVNSQSHVRINLQCISRLKSLAGLTEWNPDVKPHRILIRSLQSSSWALEILFKKSHGKLELPSPLLSPFRRPSITLGNFRFAAPIIFFITAQVCPYHSFDCFDEFFHPMVVLSSW